MTELAADLDFPECCAHCPFRNPLKASCTHDLRQSLIREVDSERTCPAFTAAKSDAMRALSESL